MSGGTLRAIVGLDGIAMVPQVHGSVFLLVEISVRVTRKLSIFIMYTFKGLSGRFAPIGVHVSLLLIMFSRTLSAIVGLDGIAMVPQVRRIHVALFNRSTEISVRSPRKLFIVMI